MGLRDRRRPVVAGYTPARRLDLAPRRCSAERPTFPFLGKRRVGRPDLHLYPRRHDEGEWNEYVRRSPLGALHNRAGESGSRKASVHAGVSDHAGSGRHSR